MNDADSISQLYRHIAAIQEKTRGQMFTVEIKVNGALVEHVYGHRLDEESPAGEAQYYYERYAIDTKAEGTKSRVRTGKVPHKPEAGIGELIAKILAIPAGKKR